MSAIALSLPRTAFLRRALLLDAATCVGTGALLALAASPLAPLLGLPAALLFYAGLALLPIGAFMAWVGTRQSAPAAAVWLVVVGNALWVLASLFVLFVFPSTMLGTAFVIAQAVVVAVLAELEWMGLRRTSA